jgi:PAS domain S-box-containing protein
MYEETQEALRQKRDYKVDFRIALPDGTAKYLEAIGHHLFSADGELVQVVGTNVDVTERKRAEQALREREAKIRRLVDANIIGIFIWDFDGRILEANEAFLHIVGYDHEDLVAGRIRWTDLTPPEWRDRDTRLIQEHKVTGTLQPFEKEYFRKDGSRVPVLIGVATFEEGGDQGVAFVLDLTERKRAEEALRESERSSRAAIDGIAGLVAIMAPNGELDALNRQVIDYFGRSLEEMKNWGTSDAVHPEDLPRIAEIFQRSIAAGTPFHYELRLRASTANIGGLTTAASQFAKSLGASCAGTCWGRMSRIASAPRKDCGRARRSYATTPRPAPIGFGRSARTTNSRC